MTYVKPGGPGTGLKWIRRVDASYRKHGYLSSMACSLIEILKATAKELAHWLNWKHNWKLRYVRDTP